MPFSPASNNFLVGLAKQTNESTVPTVSAYTTPLLTSDRPVPVQTVDRVVMTDGASIVGDQIKQAGEHWESTIVHAAWDDMLGLELASIIPTDTPSGTAPSRLHTFTGIGTTPPWVTMFANEFASSLSETFEKGICSGIRFDFDLDRPVKVTYRAVGQRPTVAAFTSTVTKSQNDGYFAPLAPANTSLKFEEDSLTPVAHTNIRSGFVDINRPVTPILTADGANVTYLHLGPVEVTAHLELVWENFDAYRATFYGAVAGSTPAANIPSGSADLAFGHTVSSTSILQLKLDKLNFMTDPPAPDPSGGNPLTVAVDLAVLKPASGDHVKALLTNNVTAAY